MLRITWIKAYGFEGAIMGMRNPYDSREKSDSVFRKYPVEGKSRDEIGEKDMELCRKLITAGSDHRKFLRMIHVQMDVLAPVYFMAELDTYKVGTTRNSSSFMHRGTAKPFEIEDFSVSEEITEILSKKNKSKEETLCYPYETDEYRIYTCENGREYEVYKNGRVFAKPFSCTDTYGTGRTRSFERKECQPSITGSKYWELNLGGRHGEKWQLHRLVAFVWCDNPNGCLTVDHLDNNKNNNSAENLEWVTLEENIRRQNERQHSRNKDDIRANYRSWKASSKVLPDIRYKIRDEYKAGVKQIDLSKKYNISQAQISVICRDAESKSDNKDLFEQAWHWEQVLKQLNYLRDMYLETKDYTYFMAIRELLPMGYMYMSTLDLDYETLLRIYFARRNHKLSEWHTFCDEIVRLPYMWEFIEAAEEGKK